MFSLENSAESADKSDSNSEALKHSEEDSVEAEVELEEGDSSDEEEEVESLTRKE